MTMGSRILIRARLCIPWDEELEKKIKKMIYPPKQVWKVPYYIQEVQLRPRKPITKVNIQEHIDKKLSWNQNMHQIQSVLNPKKVKQRGSSRSIDTRGTGFLYRDTSAPASFHELGDTSLDYYTKTTNSVYSGKPASTSILAKIALEDVSVMQ
jgi:hypothetical protein